MQGYNPGGITEGRAAIQRDLDRRKTQADRKLSLVCLDVVSLLPLQSELKMFTLENTNFLRKLELNK